MENILKKIKEGTEKDEIRNFAISENENTQKVDLEFNGCCDESGDCCCGCCDDSGDCCCDCCDCCDDTYSCCCCD